MCPLREKKKKKTDTGFSDYYELKTARRPNRLVELMPPPDMMKYEQKRQQVDDEIFYEYGAQL